MPELVPLAGPRCGAASRPADGSFLDVDQSGGASITRGAARCRFRERRLAGRRSTRRASPHEPRSGPVALAVPVVSPWRCSGRRGHAGGLGDGPAISSPEGIGRVSAPVPLLLSVNVVVATTVPVVVYHGSIRQPWYWLPRFNRPMVPLTAMAAGGSPATVSASAWSSPPLEAFQRINGAFDGRASADAAWKCGVGLQSCTPPQSARDSGATRTGLPSPCGSTWQSPRPDGDP